MSQLKVKIKLLEVSEKIEILENSNRSGGVSQRDNRQCIIVCIGGERP